MPEYANSIFLNCLRDEDLTTPDYTKIPASKGGDQTLQESRESIVLLILFLWNCKKYKFDTLCLAVALMDSYLAKLNTGKAPNLATIATVSLLMAAKVE